MAVGDTALPGPARRKPPRGRSEPLVARRGQTPGLQQAQHAIATMMKRMLHEDGTEHEDNSTASSGRSWEGDIDASWTMKEKAVGVGGRGRPGSAGRQWKPMARG